MNFIQTLDRKQPKGKFIRPDLKLTSELNMPFYWLIINAVCCLVAFYLTNSGLIDCNQSNKFPELNKPNGIKLKPHEILFSIKNFNCGIIITVS